MAILKTHGKMKRRRRWRMEGWMFPNRDGGLRCPASLQKPWRECLAAAEIHERFTVHGLRRTFVDLARRARVDGVVTHSLKRLRATYGHERVNVISRHHLIKNKRATGRPQDLLDVEQLLRVKK
jgi:integrase